MSMYEAEKGNPYLNTMAKILLCLVFLILLHKVMMSLPPLYQPSVALLTGWVQSGWIIVVLSGIAHVFMHFSDKLIDENDDIDSSTFTTLLLSFFAFAISIIWMVIYSFLYGFG